MLKPAYDLSFYEFDDAQDVEAYDVLLCDVVHGKPAMKPLYIGVGWYWYYHALRYAAESLQLPTTHGWDSRFINGYPYITTIRTTEEEAKAREPHFKENIRPFIEDFDSVWASYKAELLQTYQEAKAARGLNAWEDIRNLSDIDMLSFFLDFAFDMTRKEAEIHMIMMTSAYYINGLFLQMWQELFEVEPSIDPAFNRLMAGFESQDIKVVRQMWQLARKAVDLGLEGAFQAQNNKGILSELEKSEVGAGWLEAYRAFLLENGWRCERMHAYHTPAWIEKPELAIGQIKMLLSQDSLPFDTERDRLIQEREQAEQESLSKVPLEQRAWFEALMKAAQKAGYWSEDHTFFSDFYIGAIGRWITSEYGRRFAEAGCIDDPDDIHYLHPNEIRKAAIPMGRVNLRPYLEPRKEAWLKNVDLEPAPFYGDISQAQAILRSDPTLSVSTQLPIVREELKADLYGAAAAPGMIEGIARVIMEADQLQELKEGEIMVAPGTSAAWTVAFSMIGGLVTDGGGALSHPVIMSREYGIPCVAGCLKATQMIETGQKVRVDGDLGIVHILN